MIKIIKHLKVILTHKYYVFINCFKVGIIYRGIMHDLSKFGFIEFFNSVKYVTGDQSPTILERKNDSGFSHVAVRHTGRNRHHWQYWIDHDKNCLVVRKIPFKFALEYVCDIMAASKTYDKKNYSVSTVINYFDKRKHDYLMHPQTKEFILTILNVLNDEGFKAIKLKKAKIIYDRISKKYDDVVFLKYSSSWKELLNEK